MDFKQRVEQIIETKIRPSLRAHGGDLYLKEAREGKVWIVFTGACRGCMAAWLTLEELVEKRLREELQEMEGVYAVNETDEEILDFAKKILNKQTMQ